MEQYKQEFIEFFGLCFRRDFHKSRKVAWMLDFAGFAGGLRYDLQRDKSGVIYRKMMQFDEKSV